MKLRICAIAAIAGSLFANNVLAQETTAEGAGKKKHSKTLSISNRGIHLDNNTDTAFKSKTGKLDKKDTDDKQGSFKATFSMIDIGVNMLNDNTVYTTPSVMSYLAVPSAKQNEDLFNLRPSKSINVNITPIGVKFMALKTKKQRLYISTGLGLQIYNFRYEENLSYAKNPNRIIMDTIDFQKNKLAVSYVNIPLMVTAKTKLHKGTWLVYGAGVTAGYRMTSVNKQVSDERGKVKTRGNFGLADYNTCATAEFGVEGIIRFFASYQLTSLYDNGIDQRPISIGVRFGGI
ncbi:MAG: hypothetical protein K9G49_07395 [Taibaiella sp.]|nr:hypothetical protein [Taibaiella sp.]